MTMDQNRRGDFLLPPSEIGGALQGCSFVRKLELQPWGCTGWRGSAVGCHGDPPLLDTHSPYSSSYHPIPVIQRPDNTVPCRAEPKTLVSYYGANPVNCLSRPTHPLLPDQIWLSNPSTPLDSFKTFSYSITWFISFKSLISSQVFSTAAGGDNIHFDINDYRILRVEKTKLQESKLELHIGVGRKKFEIRNHYNAKKYRVGILRKYYSFEIDRFAAWLPALKESV